MTRVEYEHNPKKCKCCNSDIEYKRRENTYCSRSCSAKINNSIRGERSPETKRKQSESLKKYYLENSHPYSDLKQNDPDKFSKIVETRRIAEREKMINADFDDLGIENKRKRVHYEQNGKCNCCGLDKWNDQDIPLELEHKDGNHHNNSRNNLELLCPNCHAQTSTWRGRNKQFKRFKVTDEALFNAIFAANMNFRQALVNVGLSPKGGNYKRCHALIREYNNVNTQESSS